MEDKITEIAVPSALADRIENYLRQQEQLNLVLNTIGEAAAAALGVPEGWTYARDRRVFAPPSPEHPRIEAGMRQE